MKGLAQLFATYCCCDAKIRSLIHKVLHADDCSGILHEIYANI